MYFSRARRVESVITDKSAKIFRMTNFCKNEDCPASEELLAFQTGDMSVISGSEIRSHLKVCEFCAAEVDFYSHYPPSDDAVEPSEIPEPLFELAEALLTKREDNSFFDDLLGDDLAYTKR